MATVAEMIAFLQTQPPDAIVKCIHTYKIRGLYGPSSVYKTEINIPEHCKVIEKHKNRPREILIGKDE